MSKVASNSLLEVVRNENTYTRQSEVHPQSHAKNLDKIIGYKIPKIELKLLQKYRAYDKSNDESNKKQHYKGTQTWIGLHPQALQTPYNDLFEALKMLQDFEIENIIDIGAGYGRVGLVMNSIFPDSKFIGYEILKKRGEEANRVFKYLNFNNCEIFEENVLDLDFMLPDASIYFVYDFSEIDDICKILDNLSKKLQNKAFFLITKGDRIDYLIKNQYKEFWIANGFIKSGNLKIYSSNKNLNKVSK